MYVGKITLKRIYFYLSTYFTTVVNNIYIIIILACKVKLRNLCKVYVCILAAIEQQQILSLYSLCVITRQLYSCSTAKCVQCSHTVYMGITYSTNIRTRIVGGQWRHKITIYGNGLSSCQFISIYGKFVTSQPADITAVAVQILIFTYFTYMNLLILFHWFTKTRTMCQYKVPCKCFDKLSLCNLKL